MTRVVCFLPPDASYIKKCKSDTGYNEVPIFFFFFFKITVVLFKVYICSISSPDRSGPTSSLPVVHLNTRRLTEAKCGRTSATLCLEVRGHQTMFDNVYPDRCPEG